MSARDDEVYEAIAGRRPNSKGMVRANCPFCILTDGKQDRRQSLSLDTESGWWRCFRCATKGCLPRSEEAASRAPKVKPDKPAVELPREYYPLWKAPGLTAATFSPARDYLASRDVREGVIQSARIGACGAGKFAGRIIVPIYRKDGSLGGFAGRAWSKHNRMRYLYGEGTDRSTLLYNEAALDIETDIPVLAVEGTFDSFPYWPNVVAFLGKPAGTQVDMLARAKRPVVVVLDGDAWLQGWSVAAALTLRGQRAGFIRLPPKSDPADCPELVRSLINHALHGDAHKPSPPTHERTPGHAESRRHTAR